MNLVKIHGDVFVNPSCVGMVTFKVKFSEATGNQTRTNTTTVFDRSGKAELTKFETTVSTASDNLDKNAAKRDNFLHAEIIRALKLGEDARCWDEKFNIEEH